MVDTVNVSTKNVEYVGACPAYGNVKGPEPKNGKTGVAASESGEKTKRDLARARMGGKSHFVIGLMG